MKTVGYSHIKGSLPKCQYNENSQDGPKYMQSTVLSGLHLLTHSSQQPYELGIIVNSTLQRRKLRKRGFNWPAQEYS